MTIKRKFIIGLTLTAIFSFASLHKVSASIPTTKRLAGADRYATSLKVAQDGWSSSYYAVLASGENYPDALSSIPLAKKYDAPILLTHGNYIDGSIVTELENLNIGKVFVIGGRGAVNDSVISRLNSLGMQTERIGGANRYDTSVKIAEKFGKVDTLAVATGMDYADALSIGPAAALMGIPVILVPKNIMPEETKAYVKNLNTTVDKVFIVGDNSVVSDNVAGEFENTLESDDGAQQFGNVERITGKDKYERNINVIARFLEKTGTSEDYNSSSDLFSLNNLYIASGEGFADALSGAAEAAKNKAPVILSGESNSELIKNFILTKIPNYEYDSDIPEYLTVLGGQGVMPDSRVGDIFGDVFWDKNASTGDSSTTVFKDSNLEKLIREKVGMPVGTLNYSDLKNITSLDLSNQGIKDISGLENCVNLKSLDLSYNQITSVKPLLKLYNLQDLNLSHNRISDVSYLSNLTSLGQLNLSDNDIDTLGYSRKNSKDDDDDDYDKTSDSVFEYMTRLTSLDLSNSSTDGSYKYKNSISSSDLSDLKYLIRLTSLNLKGTNVGSLTNLEKLTTLNTLNLSDTNVSNLDTLKKLTNLTYLDLSSNDSIDGNDLKPLQNLTGLKYLNLSNNDIDKLTYISGLTNLKTLYLEDNPILDYTPILSYEESLYYRDFDISSISGDAVYSPDSTINAEIKSQISDFESSYNYKNYDKLRFRVLYRSYDSGAYNGTLQTLRSEMSWLKQKIASGGLSDTELKDANESLSSVQNELADIDKKDSMNKKVKDLENQLSTSNKANDMEEIINKINYIYSDYRYDYYRTLEKRYADDIQNIEAQIQTIGLQDPGYSGSDTIDSLQNALEDKKDDRDFAEQKINMYDNYRNFFNAVNSVLEEN
ncbi:MAG: cell wall-binding repeat-containing protein [Clostridium sp.]|uniref:cell wall-binding repeat-containing protein n=1 Tax=Clostridium sp. TaxID=1506 RepID=UPI0025BC55EF|nr:cell wall-binding repeat-containing protein [Clostridium sp.]MCH3964256.1 cell wall-binding repeat-containing protein [Clostridium sp.]MCI1715436.1 cell wall-binding repeat-containing protein [Clostridium sp.]MCI1799773.1 cell wall-binding repeat-containing protein [Clostridium sp.]MCI1813619.1 cell wall-binding repeat-containing protein [Clostridium sp.]MCI1870590.1 cell wall-binding repeat-containing protein [Clostridium sp.]